MAKGSTLKNCRVKGPVTIGAGCRISGATLGPYVAIGDGAEIVDSNISHSLVFTDAHVKGVTFTNSIIGERVRISGQQKTAPVRSLLVGADAILEALARRKLDLCLACRPLVLVLSFNIVARLTPL